MGASSGSAEYPQCLPELHGRRTGTHPAQFPENNVITSVSERDFQCGSLTNHCGSGRKWFGKRPPQASVPQRSELRHWTQGRQEPGFVLSGRLWRGDPGSTGEGNQEPVFALAKEELSHCAAEDGMIC